MKSFKAVSWLFQLLFLIVSLLFTVPLSLTFGIPALIFLWVEWLSEFLHRGLVILALLFMGMSVGFLMGWSMGVGAMFLGLYFLFWSWLQSFQPRSDAIFWIELAVPLIFVSLFTFGKEDPVRFWLVQCLVILLARVIRFWRRRVRVWSTIGSTK